MKDAVGQLLPLLLSGGSPPLARTADVNRLKAISDSFLFALIFLLQAWLTEANAKVARLSSTDAKTLCRSIAGVRDSERLLLGVLLARRSPRWKIPAKRISQSKKHEH